jgi:hypothetical protein
MFYRPTRIMAALGLTLTLAARAAAQKQEAGGVYVDGAGRRHPWTITATHTLMWEQQPYVPIGGTFSPRFLAEGATEENWNKDIAGLNLLKSKGVQDIIVEPVVSAVDVPPAAWQRLIDYLEANGFRYGIAFGAGIARPLTGTVIKPGNYRVEEVRESADVSLNVGEADSARYFFADRQDGSVIMGEGKVNVQNGTVLIPADSRVGSGAVALLYPHRTLRPIREGGLPDLWAGFDAYRDKLLTVFSKVRFGPGLRFFLDPLVHPIGILGEAEFLIPDSPAFRLEWEAYLTQRYPTLDDLMTAWGLSERDLQDFRQAARLIPLWASRRGIPFMLDTATGKREEVRANESRFWRDLQIYRDSAVAYYMNAAADLLRREIANVPVVYTRTVLHSIFTNSNKEGGFDGLGIAAYARGSALVTGGADSVYSQCEESARPLWCVVTETLDTAATANEKAGYSSREAMFYDLDWLRSIGAKGFYVNGFQVLPEDTSANCQLLRVPEQIDWLKDYGDRLRKEMDLAASHPRVLPFPANAAGLVRSGPIGNGDVWWVPSLAPGKPLQFGTSYAGYSITLDGGDAVVLWSLRGARETHLFVRDARGIEVTSAEGQPLPIKKDTKKGIVSLLMDDRPVVLRGIQEVFPMEAAEDAIKQLRALISQGVEAKLPVEEYGRQLNLAEEKMRSKPPEPNVAMMMASDGLNRIIAVVQPYLWREAELADSHTFTEVALNEAASGGATLLLNTQAKPGREGYGAQFKFNAAAEDVYAVWLACSPPGPETSPFVWFVDSGQPHSVAEAQPRGASYLSNRFQWLELGRIPLNKGLHTLTLRVTDAASGRYYLALDALLLTRGLFEPNGTVRPTLGSLTDKDVKLPAKRKK